jgi:FAD/FMN-containing dehydrogenase
VLRTVVEMAQRARIGPYLGVLKRHRPDQLLMTHRLDGFSIAMDFGVPKSDVGRERLWTLTREMAEVILDSGGRFYYAKDAKLLGSSFERIHGSEAVATFRVLKARLDPQNVLQSDLSRRMLGS